MTKIKFINLMKLIPAIISVIGNVVVFMTAIETGNYTVVIFWVPVLYAAYSYLSLMLDKYLEDK